MTELYGVPNLNIPQQQQQQPQGTDPFGGYGEIRPEGYTWGKNAGQRFLNENPMDPRTGLPTGPGSYGLIPHNIALQYQAAHDRRIWELNQRRMQGGLSYGKGALNLLQSFRQGGSAAIEAGVYGGLANLKFQQAAMTQPLDLLGDYRRDADARARMRSNRAAERQLVTQIVGTAGAIAAAPFTGGMTLAAIPGILGGAYGAHQNRKAAEASAKQSPGQSFGGMDDPGSFQQAGGMPTFPGIDQSTGGFQLPAGASYGPSPQPSAGGSSQAMVGQDGPQMSQQGGPQAATSGQQGQPGQQGGMAGPPAVGSDGIFTSTAYAANGAMSQQHPIQDVILMKQMADTIEADPFYDAYSVAVNARLAERMAG